ncbi:hypothetical protein SAMN04488168_11460 [Bacillus sp. 491mf]|nr:hypothetical protein SAMN04488168_11460 [Bacillus sp. 491mf]
MLVHDRGGIRKENRILKELERYVDVTVVLKSSEY